MQSPLYDIEYCSLDLETTGVNPYKDRIIEVGIARFDFKNGVVDTLSSLLNPHMQISESSFAIHGITDDEVADAPTYKEFYPKIREFIGDCTLVIQNPQFDLSFLQIENKRNNFPLLKNYAFDTVTLARKAYPDLYNHKLETVAVSLGIERRTHRALEDALSCGEIFVNALNTLDGEKKILPRELKNTCGFDTQEKIFKSMDHGSWRGKRINKGQKLVIEYCDKSGNTTEREIFAKNIFKNGNTILLHAFCFLRNEERYFKMKRIRRLELC